MRTRHAAPLVLALLLAGGSLGCAETQKTEVRTTTSRSENADRTGDSRESSVQEQTTTVQAKPDECNGALSCTVDFVGDVIAFPFRLVSGLFRAIF